MSGCPSESTLRGLLDEILPEKERLVVERHVESCPICCSRLDKLTSPSGPLYAHLHDERSPLRETDRQRVLNVAPSEPAAAIVAPNSNTAAALQPADYYEAPPIVADGRDGSRGRFQILRPHDKGGLGQVSVALDKELNREVALKEIQPRYADDPAIQDRFELEAKITGGLEHPGIVPVYALGKDTQGRPVYAMRLIKGDSLKQAIKEFHNLDNPNRKEPGARQLALRQLLGRFIDVCNAMEYAHSRGVLHRDLKPGNIMVGEYGETLVVDWGLAKSIGKREIALDEATLHPVSALRSSGQAQTGLRIGTPAYMSPEQAAGRLDALDPVSDVYSLGATLYHLLCGSPPFEKDDLKDILTKVQHGKFPRPRSVASEVPAALEAICMKAMALSPSGRYPTARSLADDLEHWLADEPVVAAPDTFNDRLGRFVRRHRGAVRVTAVAILFVVIGFFAVVLYDARQSEQFADEMIKAAEKQTKLAEEKGKLADRNAELATNERKARVSTARQLRIATAERLAAISHTKRLESPEISLLLAVESGRATRLDDEGLLPNSHQALLDAVSGIGGRPLAGHQGAITNVAISADSRWIVTGSVDNTARVWDLTAENPAAAPRVLIGHKGAVSSVAISPDSRWIVTAGQHPDMTARVWDLTAENPAAKSRLLSGHEAYIHSVAISPDSRWIVTGSLDNTARVWDLTADNFDANPRVLRGHNGYIRSVAITSDSRWIVTGSDDFTARIWSLVADKQAEHPRELRSSSGLQGVITNVAISPDGRWIVTTSMSSTTALVWDVMTESPATNPRVLSGHQGPINSVVISPDSRWIVTGSDDKTARVWDVTAENPAVNPRVLSGHQHFISKVAVSPDSRWIVTGSYDGRARVWDLTVENPEANPRVLSGHQGPINSVGISPDSRWIVTGGDDKTARVWGLEVESPAVNPLVLGGHHQFIRSVGISPDNRLIVTGSDDNLARVWDLRAENPAANPRVLSGHQGQISSVVFSPDNRWIVTGSGDNTARAWDLLAVNPAINPRILTGHQYAITSVAISSDSRWLVTGNRDKTARIWDLTAKNPAANPRVLSGHQDEIWNVVISPDSRWIVTGSWDKTARVWDRTAQNLGVNPRVLSGHQGQISSVAITHDSRWIVTGSYDGTARVWDLTAENPDVNPLVLIGHQKALTGLAISPDGHWIVTGSMDNTARVWDLTADNPAANPRILSGHQNWITSLAISSDSHWIVTGSKDNSARVWDLKAENPAANSRVLNGHQGEIFTVAISPDSRWIVTTSNDKTARVWRWQWNDLVSLASEPGRNFDTDEWNLYFPGKRYRKTFPDLPVPGDPIQHSTLADAKPQPVKDRKPSPSTRSTKPPPDDDGHGLTATIYAGTNFESQIRARIDPQLDWLWITDPPAPGFNSDNYSIRWNGWLKAPTPGRYKLIVVSDDGVRLKLDDKRLIDDWQGHLATRHEVAVELGATPHRIQIEYFEYNLGALISLRWSKEGDFEEKVVPRSALFHDLQSARNATVEMPARTPDGNGLRYATFSGRNFSQPSLVEGAVPQLDWLPGYDVLKHDLSIRWSGWLKVPQVGDYSLRIISDDAARVFIDNKIVIDQWLPHEPRRGIRSVKLSGTHALKVEYFNVASTSALCSLRWIPPGETIESVVPSSVLFQDKP